MFVASSMLLAKVQWLTRCDYIPTVSMMITILQGSRYLNGKSLEAAFLTCERNMHQFHD